MTANEKTRIEAAKRKLMDEFARTDDREYREALKRLLCGKDFRRVMRHVAEVTRVYAPLPVENMALFEGMRRAGMMLLDDCNSVASEKVLLSLMERNDEISARNERLMALSANPPKDRIN